MYHEITKVEPLDNYNIRVTFSNNDCRLLDITPYLSFDFFCELKDTILFRTVHPCYDCVEWANEANIDAAFIYDEGIFVH